MKKYKIVHITKDDKFFDDVFNSFERDERFENVAFVDVKNVGGYKFRRIKQIDKVNLVNGKGLVSYLKKGDYDAVFFYSLSSDRYKYVNVIPDEKKVIWWVWGFDVYNSSKGMRPLIEVQLYKPLTIQILKNLRGSLKESLLNILKKIAGIPYSIERMKVLRRIDYFQPVLPIEYQIMRSYKGFHAKEFYYPGSFFPDFHKLPFVPKSTSGSIVIGHSQTPGDNHMDVWEKVKEHIPSGRRIIIPLNYLGNQDYARVISEKLQSENHYMMILKEFMPKEEYFQLMDSCTYAVYGMIRQQAIGSIYYCLEHGIKLFLYRDSIVYRYLKECGYVVYTIEEINDDSFNQPLTVAEMEQNTNAIAEEVSYRDRIRNLAFKDILGNTINC